MRKPFFFFGLIGIGISLFFFSAEDERVFGTESEKSIAVLDDGSTLFFPETTSATVGEFLKEMKIEIQEGDRTFPAPEASLFPGMSVFIEREKKISVQIDGSATEWSTYARTTEDALSEAGLDIREDDLVSPERSSLLGRKETIVVTRVEIKEEIVEKKIAFDTIEKEDDKLSWRKKIITKKGENGIRSQRFRVSYHDGKEVARKLLTSEVTKEPITEIVSQGTFVQTGKSHRGGASWYAHTGTMAAANPWLPFGSYVKVTNTENGKSVIVKINDRGPFVPGRIIDLDKVAFQQIASIGAGVINVKMEEIVN